MVGIRETVELDISRALVQVKQLEDAVGQINRRPPTVQSVVPPETLTLLQRIGGASDKAREGFQTLGRVGIAAGAGIVAGFGLSAKAAIKSLPSLHAIQEICR